MKKVFSIFLFLFTFTVITAEQKQKTIEQLKYAKIRILNSNISIADEVETLAGRNGSVEYFFPKKTHKNSRIWFKSCYETWYAIFVRAYEFI